MLHHVSCESLLVVGQEWITFIGIILSTREASISLTYKLKNTNKLHEEVWVGGREHETLYVKCMEYSQVIACLD